MQLLLIRHGQTTANIHGILDSLIPGPDLTPLGRRQAAAIPAALAGREVSSISASTMVRTVQTARPLADARDVTVTVDPRLREIEGGELEGTSGPEALERYVTAAWAWAAGDLDPRLPGAGDGHDFFERFDGAVDEVMARGGSAPVVVSHGASIRVWVGRRCGNVDEGFAARSQLHNTGAALVERTASGAWELVEWTPNPLGGAALHGRSGPDDDGPAGSMTEDDVSAP